MANTTFKTRIQNKYDTLANWKENNPTPLRGEVCIVEVPAAEGAITQTPAVLFKIGDGENDFNSLPWQSAISADVYAWAKASKKPTYTAGEISGLDAYISGKVQDTNTKYKIEQDATNKHIIKLMSQELGATAWTEVGSITTVDTVYNDTAVKADIQSLKTLVGSTAVATQIQNAIAALKLAEKYEVKGTAAAEVAKIKNGTSINDFKAVETALAGKQPTGDYATKTQAQGYANAKDAAIATAKAAGDKAQADIDALEGKVGTVPTGKTVIGMIGEAMDAAEGAAYDDTALKGRVSAAEGKLTTLQGGSTVVGSIDYKIAQAVAKIMENPDETMNSINELVTWVDEHADDAVALNNQVVQNKTDITSLKGLVGSTAVATQITQAINAALKIGSADKYALATNLTAAISRITANETAIAKKANSADLAKVATTGSIDDLTQGDGYIIFDCGTASTVI